MVRRRLQNVHTVTRDLSAHRYRDSPHSDVRGELRGRGADMRPGEMFRPSRDAAADHWGDLPQVTLQDNSVGQRRQAVVTCIYRLLSG